MNIKQMQATYRAWINKNSALTTILAIVFLAGAMIAIVYQLLPKTYPPMNIDGYYYDLENDKLFVARVGDLPPIAVPGSPAGAKPMGARAMVFACHDCKDEKDRYIGYIEIYTPEAKEALAAASRAPAPGTDTSAPPGPAAGMMSMQMMEQGHMIAKPSTEDKEWKNKFFEFMSPDGSKILQESQMKCGEGLIAKNCMPEKVTK
jgi:hypothetical protein